MGNAAGKERNTPQGNAVPAKGGLPAKGGRKIQTIKSNSSVSKAAPSKFDEDLLIASLQACKSADPTGNGMLQYLELMNALHSSYINLNLSAEERDEFAKVANIAPNKPIDYKEFIPSIKKILHRIYDKKNDDWNEWCTVSSLRVPTRVTYFSFGLRKVLLSI
jgi:hypothetical protein